MVQLCGACSGLVVFSAMILRGILIGNPTQVVITRALVGMAAAVVLGNVVGWISAILVRDNLPEPPPNEPVSQREESTSTIEAVS